MAKNYPDYDDLREQYEAGNISAVDFVTQQSDERTVRGKSVKLTIRERSES